MHHFIGSKQTLQRASVGMKGKEDGRQDRPPFMIQLAFQWAIHRAQPQDQEFLTAGTDVCVRTPPTHLIRQQPSLRCGGCTLGSVQASRRVPSRRGELWGLCVEMGGWAGRNLDPTLLAELDVKGRISSDGSAPARKPTGIGITSSQDSSSSEPSYLS